MTKVSITPYTFRPVYLTSLKISIPGIFGFAGAMRRDELLKMKTSDIEETKNNRPRTFAITGNENLVKYRKYVAFAQKIFKNHNFFQIE